MRQKIFTSPSGAQIPFTPLGLGTAAIGNLYRARSDEETDAALAAAWDAGIRYFDTAPLYGLGLAETRLNRFLRGKPRNEYVLSTKVGRLLEPCAPSERTGLDRFFDTPSRREIFDYSYDGVLRSVAFSLERLGLDRIDILYVHDIDLPNHGTVERRDAHIDTLMAGGYRALCELRDQKVIRAFGAGINDWETCEVLAARGDFDLFLLAGQYSLLRQEALKTFLPMCEARGIGIVLGGVFNSGILATGAVEGAMFDYYPASPDVLERVRRIEAVVKRHGLKLADAALRFPMGHPAIACVMTGGATRREVEQAVASFQVDIPAALWRELAAGKLIVAEARLGL
jgi:D-threo-aldose 1-dehydrogenase